MATDTATAGNAVGPPGTSGAFLALGRRQDDAVAAVALPALKGIEVMTNRILRRPRPLYTTPTVLRDDAPVEGPSFPSGHTAIATTATVLIAARTPWPIGVGLGATLLGSAFARVHQGAHHPSDTLGGFLLGLAVADALETVVLPGRG